MADGRHRRLRAWARGRLPTGRRQARRDAGQTTAAGAAIARSEFEMSLNRFGFCLIIGTYVAAVATPGLRAGLTFIGGYVVFTALLFASIRHRPRANLPRAGLAMLGDVATISFEMHVGGAATSVFYPIYLWVILGNGFRFGLRFLFMAMATALIGFGIVCRTTPYWLQQGYLSWGLLAGLVIVPAYGGTLIRKLSAARSEAEAANRAKSMFLASVSHSVRTPLNAILGSTALLRDTPLDADQGELVHKLQIGADILMSLITGLLDFMQIEADRMPVRRSVIEIATVLGNLRELLAPQARAKGLRLFVHIAHDVPSHVLCDLRHLHEILVNLVSNALKFTDRGSIVIAVTASPLAGGRASLRFSVSDTGIGIRAEAQARIFDSFTQADTTIIDRFGGTGLGLAIVKRLVLLLDGTIEVASAINEGSAFSFTLECTVAAAEQAAARSLPLLPHPRLILFPVGTADTTTASRLAALSVPVEVAASAAELASMLRTADAAMRARTILMLDCPSRQARLDVVMPMLTMIDPSGDLPRLLVADAIEGSEAAQLRRHVTSWIGTDFDAETLRATLRLCLGRAQAPPEPGRVPALPRRRLDILVADDNVTNQRLMTKILERAGHRAHVVQNGEDAVIALSERPFDLALLDVNMPVMTGLEAAREYRVLSLGQKPVPIVALTADATPDMARRCAEAGMVDCITKPVVPAALIARIDELVPQTGQAGEVPASSVSSIQSHPRFRASLPPLDREVLADLEALGGPDFVFEMLDGFVLEAREVVEQLAQAAAADDPVAFRGHAHALRSASANVGARILHELCGQCRDVPFAELKPEGARLAQRFRVELGRVQREIPAHNRPGHPRELDR